jgi:hypothetical protein
MNILSTGSARVINYKYATAKPNFRMKSGNFPSPKHCSALDTQPPVTSSHLPLLLDNLLPGKYPPQIYSFLLLFSFFLCNTPQKTFELKRKKKSRKSYKQTRAKYAVSASIAMINQIRTCQCLVQGSASRSVDGWSEKLHAKIAKA